MKIISDQGVDSQITNCSPDWSQLLCMLLLLHEYHFATLNVGVSMIPSAFLAAAWPATHSCMAISPARGLPRENQSNPCSVSHSRPPYLKTDFLLILDTFEPNGGINHCRSL